MLLFDQKLSSLNFLFIKRLCCLFGDLIKFFDEIEARLIRVDKACEGDYGLSYDRHRTACQVHKSLCDVQFSIVCNLCGSEHFIHLLA